MIMDISYDVYKALYGDSAKIPQSAFEPAMFKSCAEINRYINCDITDLSEEVAVLCVFEVGEILYLESVRLGVKSENTDGYSVTYDSKKAEIYPVIKRYLVNYLYRGVDV